VRLAAGTERVRYFGMDTPEVGERLFRESTDANRRLVGGREVLLESELTDRDRFGRLLRHVWVERDGELVLVSRELVALGLARVRTYPPDDRYEPLFLAAERRARDAGRGLWESHAAPRPTP
jgi:micrococcal nuclease